MWCLIVIFSHTYLWTAAQVKIRNCHDGVITSPTDESSLLNDITIFCEVTGFLQDLSLTASFADDVNVTVGGLAGCEFHTICSVKTIQHGEVSMGGLCTYYGDSLKGCVFHVNNMFTQPQHQWPRAVRCSSQNGAASAFCNISVTCEYLNSFEIIRVSLFSTLGPCMLLLLSF